MEEEAELESNKSQRTDQKATNRRYGPVNTMAQAKASNGRPRTKQQNSRGATANKNPHATPLAESEYRSIAQGESSRACQLTYGELRWFK